MKYYNNIVSKLGIWVSEHYTLLGFFLFLGFLLLMLSGCAPGEGGHKGS
jgi:hypothetical protein